ncbi:MAG: hypothetical protein KIT58_01560, partial [Planctomycetota bacterium]|nr:hypothetical protein [Planctomycetota bacterium]
MLRQTPMALVEIDNTESDGLRISTSRFPSFFSTDDNPIDVAGSHYKRSSSTHTSREVAYGDLQGGLSWYAAQVSGRAEGAYTFSLRLMPECHYELSAIVDPIALLEVHTSADPGSRRIVLFSQHIYAPTECERRTTIRVSGDFSFAALGTASGEYSRSSSLEMSRRFSVRRYEQPDVVTRLVETSAAMFVETTAAPTSSARTRTLRGHTVVEPSENLVFSHGERRYRLSPAYAKHLRGEGVLLLWKPRHAPLQAPTETPKPKETPKPIVFEHEVVDATVGDPREFSKSVPPTWRGVREARVSVSAVACPRNWVWEEVSWDFTYRVIVGTETAFSWSGNGLRTKGQTRNTDDPVPVANSNEARRIPFSPSPDGGVTLKIIGDQSTVRFVRDGKNVAETFPFRLKHVRITLEPIMEFEEVLRVGFQGTTRLAIPQGRVDSVPTLEPSE